MVLWNARITAYDCMDQVEWVAKVWDQDRPETGTDEGLLWLPGRLRGQGSDNPTKWLRSLLEDIRESL